MSFQWIIDNAESISINRKKVVASSTSRDGQIRAVSRGNVPDTITVALPDGIRWSDIKSDIEGAETLDKITTATITISYAKFPWFYNNVDPGGSAYSKTVICLQFPEWTIFARDQVSWSGPFIFQEVA